MACFWKMFLDYDFNSSFLIYILAVKESPPYYNIMKTILNPWEVYLDNID